MRRSFLFSASLAALAASFALIPTGRAALDLSPADGIPDVWALVQGVSGLTAAGDDDGDGQTNVAEAAAGTNPRDATDVLKIKSITKSGSNVTLVFPVLLSKKYEVQGATSLSAAFATIGAAIVPPSDNNNYSTVVAAGSAKFFRVLVSDMDSDGDGLSNYEERMIGLNSGLADSNGDGVSDLAYVTAQLAIPDVVSIAATDPSASEDGSDFGTFTVTRTRNLFSIKVPYTVSGTATSGVDYLAPAGFVSLPLGVNSASFNITPIAEQPSNVVESGESVTVTLSDPLYLYTLGAAKTATVIIKETTVASGTGLMARYYDTASTTYADAANFGAAGTYVFTRGTPPTTGSIVVSAPPIQFAGLQVGNLVKLTFTTGNAAIDNATFDHQNYSVTAVDSGSFTVSITSPVAFAITSTNGSCTFSIQSFPHPAAITRVDPTVNFDWQYGTPNGVVILPNNSPDNYSATWDAYLQPTTAGNYVFQLDADDKARVLLDTGAGLVQILEHGWDGPATVGTFKQSASIPLVIPATPAQRYRIRVEHVETTSDARCRLQWSLNGSAFANISQTNQFTHTQAVTYGYTRNVDLVSGSLVVTPTGGHSRLVGDSVSLTFSSGNLFTPTSYSGPYTITAVNGTSTFTVAIAGAGLPATGIGSGFVDNSASTTTGLLNRCYANTTFTGSPGRVGVDTAITNGNNGVWGSGTPDPLLIQPDTFSVRWSGQVQPQYTEEYTFVLGVDDGCALWINGQPQVLKMSPSANTTGSTYTYDAATGNAVINYVGLMVPPGGYAVGETVRLDPSSGNLSHAPTTPPTYRYDDVSGDILVNYSSLTNVTPGGFVVGETIELDPTSGSVSTLGLLPYVIAAATSNTFTVNAGGLAFNPRMSVASIATGAACEITTVQNHGLSVGSEVRIASVTTGTFSPDINGLYTVFSVVSPTKFTVASNCTVAPTAGTGALIVSGNITISDNRSGVIASVHATGTGTYSYDQVTGDAVVNFTALTAVPAGVFQNGQSIALDPATGNLNSVAATQASAFKTISNVTATTFTVNYGAGAATTGTGSIVIVAPSSGLVAPGVTTAFTCNFGAGKYANNSAGSVSIDIINKPLKDWSSTASERFVHIPMTGGVRYDIQLDYFENTAAAKAQLSWYSPSQPRQIIPSERLYPTSTPSSPLAPPILLSPTEAVALVGGPFSYAVAGSNGANVTISGNPAWLTYSNGVLSGAPTPGTAGHYQIVVTTTGPAGTGVSVIELDVQDTGGTIAREYWSGVAGTGVSSIPVNISPTGTGTLSSLEGPTDFGDNYGARIRGYITAPTTGNYYFWIAASNAAELWIANDDEPINIFKRASVTTGNAASRSWSGEASQKSPWLALEAGKRYYVEILHKAGSGSGDNLAVGWLKPGETDSAPSEVVPGYVLSPYVAPSLAATPGTLYVSTMLSQSGAATNGVGSSTLRLSADENYAIMTRSYSGLTGQITSEHIHADPYLSHPSDIIFDIDSPGTAQINAGGGLQPDGSYKWVLLPIGTFSKADLVEIIKEGKAYINLHTALYPAGEIRGNYTLANGTRTFTPPPAPPAWTDDHATNDGASRFLTQATFGANPADIAALKAMASYDAWINDQFNKPVSYQLAEVLRTENASAQGGNFDETLTFNAWWKNSISGTDQLRQRVAYALSQIHVVSGQGPLDNNAPALSYFYDHLVDGAFGNFGDLLKETTLTPGMGRYLDMLRNDKPDLTIGRSPNENYAREIKQLFSVGLYRMWPDGSLMLNSKDELIPTYTQREIVGFAHVFTGWDYGYDGADRTTLAAATNWMRPMREVPARHFTGPKRVLNNEVLPGLQELGGQPLDPYATHNAAQINDPAYKSLPGQELDASHKQLFNHPNVGPFICRQLIQRMVMSNPSRDYVYRVVQKFNDNGSGVRGDMRAVIKAILLDYEARSNEPATGATAKPTYGKQREPVLRVAAAARAFRPSGFSGTYAQTAAGGRAITVTTTTPHNLASGNNVFLDFTSGSPAPWIGTYSVSVSDSTHFTVQANGWAAGTYSQSSGSNVMTISIANHWLPAGGQAYFDFTSGTANGLAGLDNTVQTAVTSTSTDTVAGTTFTITAPDTTARSGNVMIPRFSPGSFTSVNSGLAAPNDRRVTMDTNFDHHLNVGDQVQIVFFTGANPIPTDRVVTVESVVDLNTWTFLAPALENSVATGLGTNQGNNSVYQFPLVSQPLTRSGNVNSRPSTFAMGNTDADFDQTPIYSPTVFNFFLPDYKLPGALASQGITTPEFQDTAETNVIRESNFFERGVYALGNTNGLSSFKSGSNALVMDLIPWMGNASGTVAGSVGQILGAGPSPATAWTSNANLSALIDRLNTLLLGGKLPAGAKAQIQNFVGHRSIASISTGNPCTVTTTAPHGFGPNGTTDNVTISGVTGGVFAPTINATYAMTVTGPSTFTVPVNCTATIGISYANAVFSAISYNNTTPNETNKRDRLRAILHFLLTSPDFIIQR